MLSNNDINEIENKIGYTFKNKELLVRAFTHSSFVNEHKNATDYERLEFLGDAVLGYIVGLYLYKTFPNYNEGKLTKIRANVVDRTTIASVVADMDIMKFVRVGAGNAEENILHSRKSNCDIFEAIIGAIVIDNDEDLTEAENFILHHLKSKIGMGNNSDYKSRVWEYCAKNGKKPEIILINEQHNAGSAYFQVALHVDGTEVSRGEGGNKGLASQDACKKFFNLQK